MTIVNFSWPGNAPQDWAVKPYNWILQRVMGCEYDGDILDYSNVLLIIDEAQNSYRFTSFWNDVIKYQAQGNEAGPYIVMFSSFGSPSSQKTHHDYEYSAPLYLKAEQRVSMRPLTNSNAVVSLYLSRAEFSDVVERFKTHTMGLPFSLTDEVEDFLFDVTAGHPGCSAALLYVLEHSEVSTGF
jgi:hypothetical protein